MFRGISSLVYRPEKRGAPAMTCSVVVYQWVSTMTNVSTASSANASRSRRYPGSTSVVSAPVPPSSTRTCGGTMTIGWWATTATATISPMGRPVVGCVVRTLAPLERADVGCVVRTLAPLERAERAVPGGDVLHVAEEVEAPAPALAADARPPGAAEGRAEIADEVAVDPDGAGHDAARRALGARRIARVDDGGEAVVGPVGQADGLLVRLERLPREDRAEDLVLDDLGVLRDAREDRRLVVEPPARVAGAPEERDRARCPRAVDEPGDAIELARMDEGADAYAPIARVSDDQRARGVEDAPAELRLDRRGDEDPRAGQAHLPGVVELGRHGRRGLVEVRVVEYDERRLATELEAHRHEARGTRARDGAARRDRPGEADPIDAGVVDEGLARLGARPLHHVEDAGRHARVARDRGEQRAGERRPLGRLEHHGVPGREGGAELPRREHERRVPRGDERGDPGGLVDDAVVDLVMAGDVVLQVAGELREERHVVSGAIDDALQVAHVERAVVHRLDRRELLLAVDDPRREAVEDGAASFGAERRPAGEGCAGGADRLIDVARGASAHLAEARSVDRREDREGGVPRGRRLPADPVARLDLDAGDAERGDHDRRPSQCAWRSTRLRTLPGPDLGKGSVRTSIRLGTL